MKQVTCMMAGIVVDILVKPGDKITDGMEVAVLESMKMQLPVPANTSGRVTQVVVVSGDFVNEGDPLLILE